MRALCPHIGARLQLANGELIGVQRAAVAAEDDVSQGTLADIEGRLLYGTAEGTLELLCVQPPGGRPMDAAAYLRGHAG